jgi:hypothetical protein
MQRVNLKLSRVRGTPQTQSLRRTPHPTENDVGFVTPSPARGEGTIMSASLAFTSSQVIAKLPPDLNGASPA